MSEEGKTRMNAVIEYKLYESAGYGYVMLESIVRLSPHTLHGNSSHPWAIIHLENGERIVTADNIVDLAEAIARKIACEHHAREMAVHVLHDLPDPPEIDCGTSPLERARAAKIDKEVPYP